jgi:N-acetylglucosaminyldiphosphoundecaprenol N-acetyl-beta-D-mannosaminyltransferase
MSIWADESGTATREAAAAVTAAEALLMPRSRPAHVPVGPLSVFNGTIDDAVGLCLDAIQARRGLRVATANMDFVARARRDATLRRDLEASSLVVADGAPVAWLARAAGGRRTRRVTGVDLVGALCEAGGRKTGGLRVALYGSDGQTAARAAATLEDRYPGATVVARICPPFRPLGADEVEASLQLLASVRPDLVLVALGCPRQERFIAEHFFEVPGAVWVGIGGTLDFYAGKRKRAPRLVQAAGCEWLARLAQEPRRLWRRYLVDDLPGLLRLVPAVVRRRKGRHPDEIEDLRRVLTGAA